MLCNESIPWTHFISLPAVWGIFVSLQGEQGTAGQEVISDLCACANAPLYYWIYMDQKIIVL
jgi:hypothetical protein